MTYTETLAYIFTQLPSFGHQGADALNKKLDRTLALLEALGNPHLGLRFLHVGGTNGKGSTSSMLAAILAEAGQTPVGLFTSPHVVDFSERIQVNGTPVHHDWVVSFVQTHKTLIDRQQPTFFELLMVMAMVYFQEMVCRWVVLEVGIGGQWDATNVVRPELSVITHIDYDHTEILGDTLAAIAAQKAGIIKPGIPVVVGRRHPETDTVFIQKAQEMGAPLYWAPDMFRVQPQSSLNGRAHYYAEALTSGTSHHLALDLKGNYQRENLAIVLAALEVLQTHLQLSFPPEVVASALANVRGRVVLRGRMEEVRNEPRIIADVAHNPEGLESVLAQVQVECRGRLHIVFGVMADKDILTMQGLLPAEAVYYWVAAASPRAYPASELSHHPGMAALAGQAYASVAEGVQHALSSAKPSDTVLIAGSAFVVSEALKALG